MRFLAIACGIAAAVIVLALGILLVTNSKGDTATAKTDDSGYAVTFDGSDVYGDGVEAPPNSAEVRRQVRSAKTKEVALIRDPEEKYASPEEGRREAQDRGAARRLDDHRAGRRSAVER